MASRQPKNLVVSYCYIKDGKEFWVEKVNIDDISPEDKLLATKLIIHPQGRITNLATSIKDFRNIGELFLPDNCQTIYGAGKDMETWCLKLKYVWALDPNFHLGMRLKGRESKRNDSKTPITDQDSSSYHRSEYALTDDEKRSVVEVKTIMNVEKGQFVQYLTPKRGEKNSASSTDHLKNYQYGNGSNSGIADGASLGDGYDHNGQGQLFSENNGGDSGKHIVSNPQGLEKPEEESQLVTNQMLLDAIVESKSSILATIEGLAKKLGVTLSKEEIKEIFDLASGDINSQNGGAEPGDFIDVLAECIVETIDKKIDASKIDIDIAKIKEEILPTKDWNELLENIRVLVDNGVTREVFQDALKDNKEYLSGSFANIRGVIKQEAKRIITELGSKIDTISSGVDKLGTNVTAMKKVIDELPDNMLRIIRLAMLGDDGENKGILQEFYKNFKDEISKIQEESKTNADFAQKFVSLVKKYEEFVAENKDKFGGVLDNINTSLDNINTGVGVIKRFIEEGGFKQQIIELIKDPSFEEELKNAGLKFDSQTFEPIVNSLFDKVIKDIKGLEIQKDQHNILLVTKAIQANILTPLNFTYVLKSALQEVTKEGGELDFNKLAGIVANKFDEKAKDITKNLATSQSVTALSDKIDKYFEKLSEEDLKQIREGFNNMQTAIDKNTVATDKNTGAIEKHTVAINGLENKVQGLEDEAKGLKDELHGFIDKVLEQYKEQSAKLEDESYQHLKDVKNIYDDYIDDIKDIYDDYIDDIKEVSEGRINDLKEFIAKQESTIKLLSEQIAKLSAGNPEVSLKLLEDFKASLISAKEREIQLIKEKAEAEKQAEVAKVRQEENQKSHKTEIELREKLDKEKELRIRAEAEAEGKRIGAETEARIYKDVVTKLESRLDAKDEFLAKLIEKHGEQVNTVTQPNTNVHNHVYGFGYGYPVMMMPMQNAVNGQPQMTACPVVYYTNQGSTTNNGFGGPVVFGGGNLQIINGAPTSQDSYSEFEVGGVKVVVKSSANGNNQIIFPEGIQPRQVKPEEKDENANIIPLKKDEAKTKDDNANPNPPIAPAGKDKAGDEKGEGLGDGKKPDPKKETGAGGTKGKTPSKTPATVKVLETIDKQSKILKEKKKPWYKRFVSSIKAHPWRTAVGIIAGCAVAGAVTVALPAFMTAGSWVTFAEFFRPVLNTSLVCAGFGGAVSAITALTGAIVSKVKGPNRDNLYRKFVKKYKECEKYLEKEKENREKIEELEAKKPNKLAKAKKINKEIKKLQNKGYYSKFINLVDEATMIKDRLNKVEEKMHKSIGLDGYIKKRQEVYEKYGKSSKKSDKLVYGSLLREMSNKLGEKIEDVEDSNVGQQTFDGEMLDLYEEMFDMSKDIKDEDEKKEVSKRIETYKEHMEKILSRHKKPGVKVTTQPLITEELIKNLKAGSPEQIEMLKRMKMQRQGMEAYEIMKKADPKRLEEIEKDSK